MESHLDSLARNFLYAQRNFHKNRRFSLVAIFALALGIGTTTVMFSVIYSVIVDALPYKNFERSVVFRIQNLANVGEWKGRDFFLPDETRAFREQNHVFEETIAYNGIRLQYDNGKSIRYWPRGETVTANTFDFLGVPPLLGRTFSPDDGRPDAPPVFVMNYHFWQSEFGDDPNILNKIFTLNGKPTTLVGIMPSRFNAFRANFWLPMSDGRSDASVMGRLKPGVTVQAAGADLDGADLDAIAHRYQNTNPGGPFTSCRRATLATEVGCPYLRPLTGESCTLPAACIAFPMASAAAAPAWNPNPVSVPIISVLVSKLPSLLPPAIFLTSLRTSSPNSPNVPPLWTFAGSSRASSF